MKMLREKLNTRRGFSLAEMLLVVLILALVGSIVVSGIPAALRAYEKVVDSANAQMLLSTTVSSLRRELAMAREVEVVDPDDDATLVSYTNGETGKKITLENSNMGINRSWEGTWDESSDLQDRYNETLLVPKTAASVKHSTDDVPRLISSYTTITYDDGVFQIEGLQIKNASGTVLAGLDEDAYLSIRNINGVEATKAETT